MGLSDFTHKLNTSSKHSQNITFQQHLEAIAEHFQDSSHSPADLIFIIVDAIPPHLIGDRVTGAVRTRMEDYWIDLLEPQLDVRRQLWHSMPAGPQRS